MPLKIGNGEYCAALLAGLRNDGPSYNVQQAEASRRSGATPARRFGMQHLPSLALRLMSLLAVALMFDSCTSPEASIDIVQPTITAVQPYSGHPTVTTPARPATQPFTSPLSSPALSPTEEATRASQVAQVSNSPLPSPPAGDFWPVYSLPGGVSFAYPPDWQVDISLPYPESAGIRTAANVVPTQAPRHLGLGIEVYSLPPDQEATLYHQAGDTWMYRESPVFRVPWSQALRIGEIDWHLYLQGYSEGGLFVRRPDLDYLFEKRALTSATLIAVHYEKSKQIVISMAQELLPDQLVMLDAQGMAAMYPEQFKVFSDILNTVTLSP